MNLDEIRDMWREDCKIEQNDLDTENFKVTVIHEKYLNIWSQFRLMLSDAEARCRRTYKEKFDSKMNLFQELSKSSSDCSSISAFVLV